MRFVRHTAPYFLATQKAYQGEPKRKGGSRTLRGNNRKILNYRNALLHVRKFVGDRPVSCMGLALEDTGVL